MAMTMAAVRIGWGTMESWNVTDIDVAAHKPTVLTSDGEGRVIAIQLPAGEKLGDHQVHERAWVMVVSGSVEITGSGGESVSGGPGLLAAFEPNERHEVAATEDARLLLVLSPWPGVGHPSQPPS
jgi:quercetin dioxygenase-like cupin family protein